MTARDVFISYASPDKEPIAKPLAEELTRRGVSVWFDEFELHMGDSLRGRITQGLSESRFGVVILSPAFFGRPWTSYELDGLTARETTGGEAGVILPVWHEISADDVVERHPTLAGRVAARSADGVGRVADEIERVLARLDGADDDDEHFVASRAGQAMLRRELVLGKQHGLRPWWNARRSGWFGQYFAFWHMTLTIPCDEVRWVLDQGVYDAASFGIDPAVDAPRDKATIVSMSPFGDDDPDLALRCGVTNFGFARRWAEDHYRELLGRPDPPSVFGLEGPRAYPGIAGVHLLMQTADDFLLFGLRGEAPDVDFYPLTWSASCEESVAVTPRHREIDGRRVEIGPDRTVADTIHAGLWEEWAIPTDTVERTTCLAIGREFAEISDEQLSLSSSVLTAVKLSCTLEEAFAYVGDTPRVRDAVEHLAWMGVRFRDRDAVLRLLRGTRRSPVVVEDIARSADAVVRVHENSAHDKMAHRSWMPTSPARMFLGSAWLWG